MRSVSTYLTICLLASLLTISAAQPYQLNWTHTSVRAQPAVKNIPPAPVSAEPQWRAVLGLPRHSTSKSRSDTIPVVDPITVQITAKQSWDHYKNRYRKVSRVESLVYRGGYPQDVVHCNRADYYAYDVYLNDLEPGDRYKVRVTWDDGSHRTVERTIGSLSATSLVIDEPLAFDQGFES